MELDVRLTGQEAIDAARNATSGIPDQVDPAKAAIVKREGGYQLVEIHRSPNPKSDGIAVPQGPQFFSARFGESANDAIAQTLGLLASVVFKGMRLV